MRYRLTGRAADFASLAADATVRTLNRMRTLPLLVALFVTVPAFADGPAEHYHVTPSEIPTAVLRDTVGALTLFTCPHGTDVSQCNPGDQGLTLLAAPNRRSARPVAQRLRSTVPISSNGYDHEVFTRAVLEWRFPVVAVRASFVCIVYDVPRDLRAWLYLPHAIAGERGFFTSFDRLLASRTKQRFFLDPLFLRGGAPAQLYSSASREHPTSLISEQDEILIPVAYRNGFVLVRSATARDSDSASPSVLGWLPVRDERGRLLLWLVNSVTC
ncbi:MAG TPA: hypothetical protein PLL76_23410 [Thermoanaerobaculia bacterium]|nr:hypothetical protein [Thermoanaerobaculia bacterium]HQP89216.1 hypothetical protein [Thermoanaerobaculia bacterium]